MDLKSPEEEVDEFLASKPSWLRKILQFDHSFSSDEWLSWNGSDWWPDAGASVQGEYERLLKRCPTPSVRRGRPRRDALADAAMQLHRAGKSPDEIAVLLRDKFTIMTRKGARFLLLRRHIR